jgi:uncharacterized membrane protein
MPRIRRRPSSSRSSFLPAELHRPLLAGCLVFVASWAFVSYLPAYGDWLFGDVRFYDTWANMMSNHLVPYRDFNIEYPPGALPVFLGPVYLRKLFGYSGTYYDWFRVELLVIGLLMLVATAYALAQLGTSRRRAYAALCLVGIGPVLLGPDALARFDYWPALLAVAAVAALVARRPMLACGFAGIGTAVKVFPVVLIPLALIELWRMHGARAVAKGIALSVAVLAAITLPFLIVAPDGISWALHRQLNRPLQVESLAAVFFGAAHQVAGVHLHVVKSAGSDNLVGSGPHLASTLSGVLTLLATLAVYVLYARSKRTREQLAVASVAAVAGYIAFSKVFSPQYLVWLVPLVPLVAGRRGLRAWILFFAIGAMTQVWSPYRYGDYHKLHTPWLIWLVFARDLLVVLLFALLLLPLRRNADELDAVRPAVV